MQLLFLIEGILICENFPFISTFENIDNYLKKSKASKKIQHIL